MTKICQDKLQEILRNFKNSYADNPFAKASVVESPFNKIAGIDSGPAT